MEHCESCDRELASKWKFCIYCGRPMAHCPTENPATLPPATPPAMIRPESVEKPQNKYDAAFWVGMTMGVFGLALIIFATVQIFMTHA